MSYNGSGTFLINSTGNPVVTGTTISSVWANALTADLATGLTNAVCKDGQSTTTALVPFANSLSTASYLRFPATKSASGGANDLDDYEEGDGNITYTLTGCTTAPTATGDYTLIGNVVIIRIPALTATSNATTKTYTGMLAPLFPSAARNFIAIISDNGGANVAALGVVETSGVITLYANLSGGAWTNSGTASVATITFAYRL